ncbi:hypothetical protein [Lysobacter sp. ISL-54]|nr:hypothetical protein [Lysobacter sp. ISL-54]
MHAVFEYLFGKSRASVRAAVRLWLLRAMFSRGVRLYRCGMEPQWSTSGPRDRRIDITGRNPTLPLRDFDVAQAGLRFFSSYVRIAMTVSRRCTRVCAHRASRACK